MEREHQLTNLSARFVDLGVKPLKTKEHKMRMVGPGDPEEAHEVIMIAGRCGRELYERRASSDRLGFNR